MNVFLRIDINVVAMILLGIVLIIAYKRLDKNDKLNEVFIKISIIIILEIFFETMTCIINKRPEHWLINLSVFLHLCLFITAPILTYYWYIFIYNWISPIDEISKKKHKILLVPVIINSILVVLTPFFGFVFIISNSNVYHRGPLFIVSSIITYFYLVYSFILVLKQRKKLVIQEFLPLLIFGILPLVGGLLQTLFYGILLMWSCSAFSLVIVYSFLQQRMIHIDSLTGAWTRGSFEYYISQRVKQDSKDRFGMVFIDLDGLKQINDEFGHSEGDYAIKKAVELVKSVLRKSDIIARLGGDEFIIVMDCELKEVLNKTIERISSCFIQYNELSDKKYKLEFSYGADIFNSESHSIEQCLHYIDDLMYENKKNKKIR